MKKTRCTSDASQLARNQGAGGVGIPNEPNPPKDAGGAGIFNPLLLVPLEGVAAPAGAGSSHVVHFAAVLGLDRPHSEQLQASLGVEGAFIPAAAKLKP